MAGSKEDMAECGRRCAAEGYVTVSANYRLALNIGFQEPTITDMLDDMDAIKNYVKEHELEWNCDSSRLAFIGFSAGAHLSLMQAATKNEDGRIKACVSISGVSDLTDPQFHQNTIGILKALTVVGIATGKEWDPEDPISVTLYQTLSPSFNTPRINCPIVIVHGTNDRIVPMSQARAFQDRLNELGKEVTLVEGTGLDHELENETFRETLMNETLLPILYRTIR
jgi:acetyl esterase/lipase